MESTLGQFIASKLPDSRLEEWDMAPKSFDFEIKHREARLDSGLLKAWVVEFFRFARCKHDIDPNLTGTVEWRGANYTLCITNSNGAQVIRGTLSRES